MARKLDIQVASPAGVGPVWVSDGHRKYFALSLSDDTGDWHHTPEQATQVIVGNLSLLFSYPDNVYAPAATYLHSPTPELPDDIVDESWDLPVTRVVCLVSVIDDTAQHFGQAAHTRRLLGLPG